MPVEKYISKDGDAVLPLFSLKGKTAIVTGAGAGIGYAIAEAFCEAGANVAMWYRTNENCPTKALELSKRFQVQVKAYQLDVTDQKAVADVTEECVKEFNSRLDIFVANAGIPWTKGALIDTEDHEHYHQVLKTNLDSVYNCAFATGRFFKLQGSGSFIATASMSGHVVNIPQLQSTYNASKAGVIHFCKSLAVEWAGFARVNTVSPGYIATEISNFVPTDIKKIWHEKTPMRREGLANELKGAFLYFASDASTYTTGSDLIVDGGYCAP